MNHTPLRRCHRRGTGTPPVDTTTLGPATQSSERPSQRHAAPAIRCEGSGFPAAPPALKMPSPPTQSPLADLRHLSICFKPIISVSFSKQARISSGWQTEFHLANGETHPAYCSVTYPIRTNTAVHGLSTSSPQRTSALLQAQKIPHTMASSTLPFEVDIPVTTAAPNVFRQ